MCNVEHQQERPATWNVTEKRPQKHFGLDKHSFDEWTGTICSVTHDSNPMFTQFRRDEIETVYIRMVIFGVHTIYEKEELGNDNTYWFCHDTVSIFGYSFGLKSMFDIFKCLKYKCITLRNSFLRWQTPPNEMIGSLIIFNSCFILVSSRWTWTNKGAAHSLTWLFSSLK